jgi:hypothetical protein
MMGLVAPINREENHQKKKEQKGSPVDDRGRSSPTQLHPEAQKKNKERRGAEAPPPPSPSIMAGNKASLPNYAHKYKKVKKGESNLPLLFKKCMKAWSDICTQVQLFTRQLGLNSLHIDLSIAYLQVATYSHGSQLVSR